MWFTPTHAIRSESHSHTNATLNIHSGHSNHIPRTQTKCQIFAFTSYAQFKSFRFTFCVNYFMKIRFLHSYQFRTEDFLFMFESTESNIELSTFCFELNQFRCFPYIHWCTALALRIHFKLNRSFNPVILVSITITMWPTKTNWPADDTNE